MRYLQRANELLQGNTMNCNHEQKSKIQKNKSLEQSTVYRGVEKRAFIFIIESLNPSNVPDATLMTHIFSVTFLSTDKALTFQ